MFVVLVVVSRLVLLITPKKQALHRLFLLLMGPLQLTMTQKASLFVARIATNRPPARLLQSRLWAMRPFLLLKFLLGLTAGLGLGVGALTAELLQLLFLLLSVQVQVGVLKVYKRMVV